jgi:isocitrate dehydrogenase
MPTYQDLGGKEAGKRIEHGMEQAMEQKKVTYDFEREMEGATKVSCSGFGDVIITNIENS